MQKSQDDPIWDLVICIAGSAGTLVWLFWAAFTFTGHAPFALDRRLAALGCVIMAGLMLSTAVSYWYQWKHARR